MPRIVDHEQRRLELATAVWRVISRDGLNAASVRAVAAESGWSTGAIRHYFSTQDELLTFAAQLMMERVPERIRVHLEDASLAPFDRVIAVLEELLPLDEERRIEVLVFVAIADRSRIARGLDAARDAAWDGTRYLCRRAVTGLNGRSGPDELTAPLDDPDLEARAARLHVIVDGLSLQALMYPRQMPPAAVRATLTAALHEITR
ncbi:TetR/AcrR family transcriptional regulator [Catenuloplanes indicus]|uniref:AcrR family transcriptional regulator n=1 Tax=Catenuloplanes indicus TaxID=137267 RepID=A0AAE4AZT4_9ACTN|nr:TetR family transcriptional regulator C-terminal domain-containing protein [Catenuloplanes indicus]MDQ0369480.1 AcrR family transcriptional regulator [Catenuloplanes indicus]